VSKDDTARLCGISAKQKTSSRFSTGKVPRDVAHCVLDAIEPHQYRPFEQHTFENYPFVPYVGTQLLTPFLIPLSIHASTD
jgi:hypothetical protein